MTVNTALPDGFRVIVRDDVAWRQLPSGRQLLVGGSPVRVMRLAGSAPRLSGGRRLTVTDSSSRLLARRLLDGNLADPVLDLPPTGGLTVVVPVRDRAEQLDRCLLAVAGLPVIVVDDASVDPDTVRQVTARHGARLIRLPANLGPADARNTGLAQVDSPYVAFVDSDVTVSAQVLLDLTAHFADRAVALVGPRIRGVSRSARPRWFERYEAGSSSLTLGRRACSVQPGAAVGWLPSACVVARVSTLHEVGGFAAGMRVGEDVDLVWRLVEEGWRVRYDPAFQAGHDVRGTIRGWLGRKVIYGTGGAPLAARHGDAVAAARLSWPMAAAAAGVLLRRRCSPLVTAAALGVVARRIGSSLPAIPGRRRLAAGLAVRGLGWALRQEAALLLRHWWPVAALGCVLSGSLRRAVVAALLVDAVVASTVDRPEKAGGGRLGWVAHWLVRRLDDLAYGSGLWIGAIRGHSPGALAVKITH